MPFRPYQLDDYPGRRVTIGTGDFRVALHVPSSFVSRARFCDPPGLPADLELTLLHRDDVLGPLDDGFTHRDHAGFSFESPACRGTVDHRARRGTFELLQLPPDYTDGEIRPLLDVALSACFDEVTRRGGLVLHGAAIRLEDRAVVMCGPSERGKTTLFSRFHRKKVPKALIESQLGDEWSFVAPDDDGRWWYWWYPYARSPYKPRPSKVPLGAVVHIGERRDRSAVHPLAAPEAARLTAESAYFIRGLTHQSVLDHAAQLATEVPAARFEHDRSTPVTTLADLMRSVMEAQ